jgi:chromosome segregation ATPase
MAAAADLSSLPPLRPQSGSGRSRKTNLKSSIFKSTQVLTESQFQREARRLSPRIAVLEAQVSALRSEIPVGLSAAFTELKDDIQNLRSAPPDWSGAPEATATDYNELKEQLLQKIAAAFNPLEAELREKIPQVQGRNQARVLRLLPIEDDAAAVQTQIADLRRMIEQRQKRGLQRLRHIQTSMAQLPQPVAGDPGAEIDEIWQVLSSHRARLLSLRGAVQDVRSRLASSVGRMATSHPEILVGESASSESLDDILYSRVPDLSGDIQSLREDVIAMESDFAAQMDELALRIKENEKAQREGLELIATLGWSLKTMSRKVDQIDTACGKFAIQADQVAGKLGERSAGLESQLRQVLAEIRQLNSTIGAAIEELRKKLMAIQTRAAAAAPDSAVDVGRPVADNGNLGLPSSNPMGIMATVAGSPAGADAPQMNSPLDIIGGVAQQEEKNDQ